ncbi:MAG: hypothetical protein NT051_00045 [Candidatus Micrarchaeota archaeon]|nr:hypothetical protein [Candidatus Micrarchaeota archaeon]
MKLTIQPIHYKLSNHEGHKPSNYLVHISRTFSDINNGRPGHAFFSVRIDREREKPLFMHSLGETVATIAIPKELGPSFLQHMSAAKNLGVVNFILNGKTAVYEFDHFPTKDQLSPVIRNTIYRAIFQILHADEFGHIDRSRLNGKYHKMPTWDLIQKIDGKIGQLGYSLKY